MGIYESPQKILAYADFYCVASYGSTYSILSGIGGSTVYIYVVSECGTDIFIVLNSFEMASMQNNRR